MNHIISLPQSRHWHHSPYISSANIHTYCTDTFHLISKTRMNVWNHRRRENPVEQTLADSCQCSTVSASVILHLNHVFDTQKDILLTMISFEVHKRSEEEEEMERKGALKNGVCVACCTQRGRCNNWWTGGRCERIYTGGTRTHTLLCCPSSGLKDDLPYNMFLFS